MITLDFAPKPVALRDDEVDVLLDSYDSLKPEEQEAAKARLQVWNDQEEERIRTEKVSAAESLYGDFETLGGAWTEDRAKRAESTALDVDDRKAALANIQWLAAWSGKEPEEMARTYDLMLPQYSKALFEKEMDSKGFYGAVQGRLKERDARKRLFSEVATTALDAAFTTVIDDKPADWSASWGGYSTTRNHFNKESAELPEESWQTFKQSYEKGFQIAEANKDLFLVARDVLARQTGREEHDGGKIKEIDGALYEAGKRLAAVSPEERQAVFGMLTAWADANGGRKGFWEQMAESMGRSAGGMVAGATGMVNDVVLNTELSRMKGVDSDDSPAAEGSYPKSEAERTKRIQELEEALRVNQVARELRSFAESNIDPIRETIPWLPKVVERGVYGAASSLPYMAAASIPYAGVALTAAGMAGQEYDRLRLKHPDIDPTSAAALASVSGTAMAAIERLQLRGALGKLPALNKLVNTLATPTASFAKRFAITGGVQVAVQNLEEGAQDLTPFIVQELGSALSEDVPGVNWKGELSQFVNTRAETAIALLPLVLVGAGVVSVRENAAVKKILVDSTALQFTGISKEKADAIVEVAKSDPAEAEDYFKAAWQDRTQADKKRGAEMYEAASQQAEALQKDPKTDSLRINDGNYEIVDPKGKSVATFDNEEAAYHAIVDRSKTQISGFDPTKTGVTEMLEFFAEKDPERQFELIKERKTLKDVFDVTPEAMKADVLPQLLERMRIAGMEVDLANPEAALSKAWVLGENETLVRDSVFQSVSKLYQGANWTTVVEETSEGFVKEAMATKRVDRETLTGWLREVEKATGQTILSAQATEQELIEGFSKTAVAYMGGKLQKAGLSPKLKSVLRQMGEMLRAVFQMAGRLLRMKAEGKLDEDFESLLAESVGLSFEREVQGQTLEVAGELAGGSTEFNAPSVTFSVSPEKQVYIVEGSAFSASLDQAAERLKTLAGKPLVNRDASVSASLSGNTISKMKSRSAAAKSTDIKAHIAALDSFEELFAKAVLTETNEDRDQNQNIVAIHRFHAALSSEGRLMRVKFTVKEFAHESQGHRIYSIEAVEIEPPARKRADADTAVTQPTSVPHAGDTITIAELLPDVKRTFAIASADYIEAITNRLDTLKRNPTERLGIYERAKQQLLATHERFQRRVEKAADPKREELIQSLAELNAIVSALPPEARAAVGGTVQLAQWKTMKKRGEFILGRLQQVDKALERVLRNEYREQIDTLLERTKPKAGDSKVRKSNLGSEAQELADKARVASLLDEDTAAERAGQIESALEKATTAEDISRLAEELAIVTAFGDLKSRSAAELAEAHAWLKQVTEKGRSSWRVQEEARLEEVRGLKSGIIEALGQATLGGLATAKPSNEGILRKVDALVTSHYSFAQIMRDVFGKDHPVAKRFADAVRRKTGLYESEFVRTQKRFREMLGSALGLERPNSIKGRIAIDKELDRLRRPLKSAVQIWAGRKVKSERVPIEIAEKMVRGEAPAHDFSLKELDALRVELAELPKDSRKEYVTVERIVSTGIRENVPMTRLEAMHYLLAWDQPDVQERMRRQGFDSKAIRQMRDLVDDEVSRAIMSFLREEYGKGYNELNPVYRRMYGMNMPRVENYAPMAYENGKEAAEVSPFGVGVSESGMSAGFVKSRQKHDAMLKQSDALVVFFGHAARSIYWKHHAELIREMRGVLGNAEVNTAIKQSAGIAKAQHVNDWVETITAAGSSKGTGIHQIDALMRHVLSGQAVALLGFRLKTMMMQTDSALRFMLRIPVKAQLRGLKNLFSGQLNKRISEAWHSETIQRRLMAGFAPEVRFLMQETNVRPSILLRLAESSMVPLQLTDAALTSVSGAIVFDYHYREALEGGLSEIEAHRVAADAMDAAVFETSQPASIANRSLVEVHGNGFVKAFMLFKSDSRLKFAMEYEALKQLGTGKDVGQAMRTIVVLRIYAMLGQFLSDLFRDGFTGEEDDEIYKLENYIRAFALGHINGLVMAGDAIEGVFSYYTKSYNPLLSAGQQASRVAENPERLVDIDDPEQMLKAWQSATRALSVVGGQWAAPAVAANMIRDAVGLMENAKEDDE